MGKIALKAENISKQYRLGEVGTGTLSHDLNRFWAKIRGKEDPFLKIGESNDRTQKGQSDYVWALRDISFEIEQGSAVGIIGRNGAGKSTLLKLLSKVTKPTTGKIYTQGRIASLLEVGTGFHPEMTGKENIYLNGAILGMTRREIKRKFEEIVDFAGVERYIDTPVKRYSSGMYVRLAFAIAAHLESEILIVDEVLAVGDAEFQKKCLGKMNEVSHGEGRTVLFVSHNMASISQLCNHALHFERGRLIGFGDVNQVISKYLSTANNNTLTFDNHSIKILNLSILNNHQKESQEICSEEDFYISLKAEIKENNPNLNFSFAIYSELQELITVINSYHTGESIENLEVGTHHFLFKINKHIFNNGKYTINFGLSTLEGNVIYNLDDVADFIIYDNGFKRGKKYTGSWPGYVSIVPEISIK